MIGLLSKHTEKRKEMKLDRHEIHVFRELRERYGLPTQKMTNMAMQHRLSVEYVCGDGIVDCVIKAGYPKSCVAYGFADCSPRDKYSEGVGRMIAFTRATVGFMSEVFDWDLMDDVTSDALENIARGVREV